jgi:hypothetical protein
MAVTLPLSSGPVEVDLQKVLIHTAGGDAGAMHLMVRSEGGLNFREAASRLFLRMEDEPRPLACTGCSERDGACEFVFPASGESARGVFPPGVDVLWIEHGSETFLARVPTELVQQPDAEEAAPVNCRQCGRALRGAARCPHCASKGKGCCLGVVVLLLAAGALTAWVLYGNYKKEHPEGNIDSFLESLVPKSPGPAEPRRLEPPAPSLPRPSEPPQPGPVSGYPQDLAAAKATAVAAERSGRPEDWAKAEDAARRAVRSGGPGAREAQELLARAKQKRQEATAAAKVTRITLERHAGDAGLAAAVRSQPNANWVELRYCSKLTDLSPLAALPGLKQLNLLGCDGVRDFSALGRLPALEDITVCATLTEKDIELLAAGSPKLKRLDLEWAARVRDLSALAKFKALEDLSLPPEAGDAALATVVRDHPGLAKLSLRLNRRIADFAPLNNLVALRSLTPPMGSGAQLARSIPASASITELVIVGGRELGDLGFLRKAPNLRSVCFSSCPDLTDLSPLATAAPNLASLRVVECKLLVDLSPLEKLGRLEALNIQFCDGLSDISPLKKLTGLKTLTIYGCKELSSAQINEVRRALPKCRVMGNR